MSELEAWIDKLNHMSTEDIRKLLVAEGIQGKQQEASNCPLARFLKSKGAGDIAVTHAGVFYMDVDVTGPQHVWSESVSNFVIRFDGGEFPQLETY